MRGWRAALCGWGLLGGWVGAQTSVEVVSQLSETGFTVPVPVQLDTDREVAGLQFDLRYDSQVLAMGEPVLGPGLQGITISTRRIAPGQRRVLIYSEDSSPLPNSILLNLPGTVPPGVTLPGVSISLEAARASDAQGVAVEPLALVSGVIELTDGVPVFFESVSVAADGTAFLTFTGVSGREVALEFSTDLETWTEVTVLQIEDGETVQVVDPQGLREKGFYRARVISP